MTVSVIIPFYNLKDYVRENLDSVLSAVANETERRGGGGRRTDSLSVEVICIDDGSSDGTGALLDGYADEVERRGGGGRRTGASEDGAEGIPRLRVIHQPNGGEGSARNAGLAAAHGEWVTFLDGDDVWLKTVLTEFVEVAGRHPQADIIGFRFLPFDDGRPVPAPAAAGPEREIDVREEIPSEAVFDLGVFPTFFRREKFSDLSFSALPLGADRLYVAACLAKVNRIVMSSAGVLGYRVRAGSMARAAWNERKIRSMVDFAAGSLRHLTGGGKRLGRKGAAYLGDVLLSVAPRKIRLMEGDRAGVRRHWIESLRALDAGSLTLRQRWLRRWHCRKGRSI